MTLKFSQRWFGFLGFTGILGIIYNNQLLYLLFLLFLFFVYITPKTRDGKIQMDERWMANITKAARNAFFISLFPSVACIAFLDLYSGAFISAIVAIPIIALSGFVSSFNYYDKKGD
ncbi:MAG: DUF3796 domain-containing protein [Candidatus Bathyarchaeia archaeon]|jgi:hypothetical protein